MTSECRGDAVCQQNRGTSRSKATPHNAMLTIDVFFSVAATQLALTCGGSSGGSQARGLGIRSGLSAAAARSSSDISASGLSMTSTCSFPTRSFTDNTSSEEEIKLERGLP